MFIDISDALRDPGRIIPVDVAVSIEPEIVLSDPVQYESVRLTGALCGAEQSASIKGEVRCEVVTRCARCLEPVRLPVTAELDAVFARDVQPDDMDRYPLEGSHLDPARAVHEAVLLELPMRFLCSEDCKGLCPVCGADRNQALCTCHTEEIRENAFAALSDQPEEDEEV